MRKGWFGPQSSAYFTESRFSIGPTGWKGGLLTLAFLASEGGIYLLLRAAQAEWPLAIGGLILIAFVTAVIILQDDRPDAA
ncbi:hypothetical protein FBZ92_108213 [Nitrospirillum viridazoti]|uniref:Uncharacterized protein n=2 Tax=Nitrospirillum TaxID=1543705 RepID=A0A560IKU5_9PROT|nr:hypothetical protein FBZ92_108213 [Nitrospirillum amazonense]